MNTIIPFPTQTESRDAARERLLATYPALEKAEGSAKRSRALGAANLRRLLKVTFPTIRFSVTSERYSGGNSINVRWTDGPTTAQVKEWSDRFQKCDFDGSDDSTHYRHEVWPELFGGASYVLESRSLSADACLAVAREHGWPLVIGPHGEWQGLDCEQDEAFRQTVYGRDFLAVTPTPEALPHRTAPIIPARLRDRRAIAEETIRNL